MRVLRGCLGVPKGLLCPQPTIPTSRTHWVNPSKCTGLNPAPCQAYALGTPSEPCSSASLHYSTGRRGILNVHLYAPRQTRLFPALSLLALFRKRLLPTGE